MFIIEYVACDSWDNSVSVVDEEFYSLEEANKWLEDNSDWVVEWRYFEIVEV